MDGTLIDSKKDITLSINAVRKLNHNLEQLSEEFVVEAINKEERNLPKLFYATQEYGEKDRVAFEAEYAKQCTQNTYLYEGIKEMLYALKEQDVQLSVATNAPTLFAKIMLEHLEVAKLFDLIIGADRVTHSKPNPEMLYKILDFYKYNPAKDSAWMVGDNSKDMLSALNAKIEGIFATWGFSPKTDFSLKLQHPKELLPIIL